ncbi:efflux transporter outer membrane subunit [Rhizosphaericola mali]|uniref:Efflux transporter outer membrane subunit n=1 Tax=Rhizosphaericola mali TaxID=2545455 RepID=A0A5P2FWT6_9BACT|nr:efflux transporter outer membrane subunit [Rhizosphaericola mali]QES87645.1 efflux transporter outer membrane subunit [Rhizosphaericola mali]
MKKINKVIFIFFILGLLLSCKVSKDIQLPSADLPTTFDQTAPTDSVGIGSISWKRFFSDSILSALIDSALRKNYDMAIALKNIEAASQIIKQSKWNNIPTVDFNTTIASNRPSKNSLNGLTASKFLGTNHIDDYSIGVGVSWAPDIWGKIRNLNKSALANYLQTKEVRNVLQTDLIASVSKGYINLLMLDEQLRIAKNSLALNDTTVSIANAMYDFGQASLLAVQQAKAQLLSVAELIPVIEQEIAIQENALHVLSSNMPGTHIYRSRLDAIKFSDSLSTGIPTIAIRQRPDVRKCEFELLNENAKVGIAKAQLYPAVNITARGGLESLKASNWFSMPNSLFGLVSGSLLQPLLQHKELRTQYSVAKIEREKSVINFKQTVLSAVGEVSDAMQKIEKLKQQDQIVGARVAMLHDATSNINQLFQNGMVNYLEVINAESNALDGDLEQMSVKQKKLSAIADLYRSLGGGIF